MTGLSVSKILERSNFPFKICVKHFLILKIFFGITLWL